MKKGLISLAIVLSMVVSLFAPAIMVSAEEATGSNDLVDPVVIDFENGGRLDGELQSATNGTFAYTENSLKLEVTETVPGTGYPAAQVSVYTPTIVQNNVTEYKAFVVIYKYTGRGWAEFVRGGTANSPYATIGTNSVDGNGYTKTARSFPVVAETGKVGGYYNRIDIKVYDGSTELAAGTSLEIAAIAYFATESAAAAFDLDTWRAEHRNVSIEAPTEAKVGETVTATIAADGESFIASSKLTVKYDATRLTYVDVDGLAEGEAVNDEANGIIEIFDFGATKEANEYKINFEAKDMGDAKIELTYAGFSTSANAAVSDLIAATITTKSATVTLTGDILVTLPGGDWFDGNTSVVEGQPYEFTATKWANYDYPEVTYTMGDGEAQVVTPDAEGKYTIENVTGNLVISIASDPTGKLYDYTVNGDLAQGGELDKGANHFTPGGVEAGKVQYGHEIWFTVPVDKEASGLEPGYTYGTPVITMGGEPFTDYTVIDNSEHGAAVYVIAGSKITGELVERNPLYDYTITATEGGQTVELVVTENDTVYTVVDVHGAVLFTVNKTVKVGDAGSEDYITVEGNQMWLVTIGSEELEGQSYAYDGNKMFWSEKYGAYCYLVISNSTPDVSADMFSIVDEDATEIVYDKDVNKTGRVDVNDAQFVYDMYNFEYDAFTSDVTVEKFLRADLNDTKGVDTTDAQVIMSAIMPAVQG